MPSFVPGLPARQVDRCFARTVRESERVRRNLVLWFADLVRRRLYLELGYTSIYAYSSERHGFSKSRCAQLLRVVGSLEELPELRRSVAAGEMPWTKAREVVKVATRETEGAWVREAKRVGRRALERKVAVARGRAAAARGPGRGQAALALEAGPPAAEPGRAAGTERNGTTVKARTAGPGPEPPVVPPALPAAIPEAVRLRFPALLYAEYGALVEALRKRGFRGSTEELIVAGLAALAERGRAGSPTQESNPKRLGPAAEHRERKSREAPKPDGNSSAATRTQAKVQSAPARREAAYQVVVQHCPDCGRGRVVTGRGPKPLRPAELEAVLCDTRVHIAGKRNRAVVPPALRREVLERDGHRCRVAGCGSTRFLAVHHVRPRQAGGPNRAENLVTLCGSCHRAIHELGARARSGASALLLRRPPPASPAVRKGRGPAGSAEDRPATPGRHPPRNAPG